MAESDSKCRVISSKDAKAKGLRHYFTGERCKRDHLSLRLVSTLQCCQCLRERMVWYREANREKYREYDRNQKSRDRLKLRERDKKRYWSNPQRAVDRVKDYYWSHAEERKAKRRKYWNDLMQFDVAAYEEKLRLGRERVRRWVLENPDKAAAVRRVNANRRRSRMKALGNCFSRGDVEFLFAEQHGKCVYCKCDLGRKYHVDHIQPVSRGGTNDRENLQLLCKPCNLEKGARDPIAYARMRGLSI